MSSRLYSTFGPGEHGSTHPDVSLVLVRFFSVDTCQVGVRDFVHHFAIPRGHEPDNERYSARKSPHLKQRCHQSALVNSMVS